MKVNTIKTNWATDSLKQNTYLVELENCAVVVDAGCPLSEVKKLTDKPIKAVFITHSHYDHVQYIEQYALAGIEIYGHFELEQHLKDPEINVTKMLGKPTKFNVKVHKIFEQDQFVIDGTAIDCYLTPGHTSDSITYVIGGELFPGDTTFSLAVGRTDLPTGNQDDLVDSLNLIKDLEFSNAYSGHGRASTKTEQFRNIIKWINHFRTQKDL